MTVAANLVPDASAARAPPPAVLLLIAVAGCAAAVCTFALAEVGDEVTAPTVRASLMVWTALPYVLAGLVAWWHRPESRLGLLMVVAGFVFFLSALSMANLALPYTVGIACDLLPAVVFLHVFLAFPSGRL